MHRETRAPNGKGSSSEPQTHNILIYKTGSQQASAINVPRILGNIFGGFLMILPSQKLNLFSCGILWFQIQFWTKVLAVKMSLVQLS